MSKKQKKELAIKKEDKLAKIKDNFSKYIQAEVDPDKIKEDASEAIYDYQVYPKNNKRKKELQEIAIEKTKQVYPLFNLDNHCLLSLVTGDQYKSFAIDFANKIVLEYQCKTPSEKALAEIISGAYVNYLEYSYLLRNALKDRFLSQERNNYYNVLSKHIEKAHRQYITGLTTLKQLKNPPIEVNVKTKNAFISNNQQINATQNINKETGEIING